MNNERFLYFFYDFRTIQGLTNCNKKASKEDFDQDKINDEKYIRKFLKKHTKTYLPSCKIISCKQYCEWFVNISVDLSEVKPDELIGKKIDIATLNSIMRIIDKYKYKSLFSTNNIKLKDKYYESGCLSYGDVKVNFNKIEDSEPYLLEVTSISY